MRDIHTLNENILFFTFPIEKITSIEFYNIKQNAKKQRRKREKIKHIRIMVLYSIFIFVCICISLASISIACAIYFCI